MKKRAYTLTEVLITLGIIGILAAIIGPMVNKFKPDTMKALYLNTYDALSTSISTMIENDSIYPVENDPPDFNYIGHPFANQRAVNDLNIIGGTGKFCQVLSRSLSIIESDLDVRNRCQNPSNNNPSFTGKNGVEFFVRTASSLGNSSTFVSVITVDLNGQNRGFDCEYDNRNSCTNPDRFQFRVYADGEFLPADLMGIRYLETRTSLRYKKVEDESVEFIRTINDLLQEQTNKGSSLSQFSLPRSANIVD